ncbi:hypothetical protein [Desulfotomaculum copahuensis]|uniref:Uncharacterized protein n=1 Tax=Desulfotomaculum copahuensis TaxID=1838280 RepID=A0A1B7LGH3_9FIRM|nr:hypothetical protein [Desulfotomaculum copahuensis]OAT85207.1 hypothetical protein A6M21_06575 [Desulfotomaculum copahuensis]
MGRKVVAVGSLKDVWTLTPEEMEGIEDMAGLEDRFARRFGFPWTAVMTGGDRPFPWHRDWDAYLAVQDMKKYPFLLTLPDLMQDLSSRGIKVYQTIIG